MIIKVKEDMLTVRMNMPHGVIEKNHIIDKWYAFPYEQMNSKIHVCAQYDPHISNTMEDLYFLIYRRQLMVIKLVINLYTNVTDNMISYMKKSSVVTMQHI